MDKYIDNFCDEYFSDFEELAIKNRTDDFFKRAPRFSFRIMNLILLGVILLVMVSLGMVLFSDEKTKFWRLCYDVVIGLLTGTFVSYIFILRDKYRLYYEEVVRIITERACAIKNARSIAMRYMLNKSKYEGMRLLQVTAQNAYEFAGYIEDRHSYIDGLNLVKDLSYNVTADTHLTDSDIEQNCNEANDVIKQILSRLSDARFLFRTVAYGCECWEAYKVHH